MTDITTIPIEELLKDRAEAIADYKMVRKLSVVVFDQKLRSDMKYRADVNIKVVWVIENELTRREHPFEPYYTKEGAE